MIFSTNQARQLFVLTAGESLAGSAADSALQHFIHGSEEKVLWANATSHKKMARNLKSYKVSLDANLNGGAPISGQDYILTINLIQYPALGVSNTYAKFAAVHAPASMDAAKFYETLVESLEKNFSREGVTLFTFKKVEDGVVITEAPQKWVRGTMPQVALNFNVAPSTVTYKGEEIAWGTVAEVDSEETIYNGKLMADLEYFCMGERADIYRGMGWPNVVTTEYKVDPAKAYDVIDIQFAYVGSNESVQKSEKTLTILVEVADATSDADNAATTSVVTALADTYGVEISLS